MADSSDREFDVVSPTTTTAKPHTKIHAKGSPDNKGEFETNKA
jgi:hypothetical protein